MCPSLGLQVAQGRYFVKALGSERSRPHPWSPDILASLELLTSLEPLASLELLGMTDMAVMARRRIRCLVFPDTQAQASFCRAACWEART